MTTPKRCRRHSLSVSTPPQSLAYRPVSARAIVQPPFAVGRQPDGDTRGSALARAYSPACVPRDGGVCYSALDTPRQRSISRASRGLRSAGVICEILNKDGTTARRPQLEVYAKQHGLTFITIAQLVAYRLKTERLVHRVAEARLPTAFGEWRIIGYRNDVDTRRTHCSRVW